MLCSILLLDETGMTLERGAGPGLPEDYNAVIDNVPIGSCGSGGGGSG